jgi:hypothetical protein
VEGLVCGVWFCTSPLVVMRAKLMCGPTFKVKAESDADSRRPTHPARSRFCVMETAMYIRLRSS